MNPTSLEREAEPSWWGRRSEEVGVRAMSLLRMNWIMRLLKEKQNLAGADGAPKRLAFGP
jgi:hypothetical protein